MGRKKKGDDFLDLPDPDEEGDAAGATAEDGAGECARAAGDVGARARATARAAMRRRIRGGQG